MDVAEHLAQTVCCGDVRPHHLWPDRGKKAGLVPVIFHAFAQGVDGFGIGMACCFLQGGAGFGPGTAKPGVERREAAPGEAPAGDAGGKLLKGGAEGGCRGLERLRGAGGVEGGLKRCAQRGLFLGRERGAPGDPVKDGAEDVVVAKRRDAFSGRAQRGKLGAAVGKLAAHKSDEAAELLDSLSGFVDAGAERAAVVGKGRKSFLNELARDPADGFFDSRVIALEGVGQGGNSRICRENGCILAVPLRSGQYRR